ncbi:MAG: TIGR03643 family protein [Bacteroidia bacterium]|nr:TIGR03643 family protein [Bacteroidia bacterium]
MKHLQENENVNFCYYSGLPSPLAYAEIPEETKPSLSIRQIDRIIEMAWEDRTPFEAIYFQFGLNEAAVKALMKKQLKFSSYKLWRERVEQCKTKHAFKRVNGISRFKCDSQRQITHNKLSKRK